MTDSTTQANRFMNRLAREASPYLLQHAENPVEWYPWGEEALSRAKAEDKPILSRRPSFPALPAKPRRCHRFSRPFSTTFRDTMLKQTASFAPQEP